MLSIISYSATREYFKCEGRHSVLSIHHSSCAAGKCYLSLQSHSFLKQDWVEIRLDLRTMKQKVKMILEVSYSETIEGSKEVKRISAPIMVHTYCLEHSYWLDKSTPLSTCYSLDSRLVARGSRGRGLKPSVFLRTYCGHAYTNNPTTTVE